MDTQVCALCGKEFGINEIIHGCFELHKICHVLLDMLKQQETQFAKAMKQSEARQEEFRSALKKC